MLNKNTRTSLRAPALAALALGVASASAHAAPARNTAHGPTHRASWGSRAAAPDASPAAAPDASPAAAPTPTASTAVILRLAAGGLTPARQAALTRLGADVTRHLDFIGSVAATVPTRRLAQVAALPFVTHLSSDGQVKKCDEFTQASSGAGAAYQQYGLTGAGVTVAVVDSGMECSHWDLLVGAAGASRVTASKDFVYGYTSNQLYIDYCGHGTHVAGIIAGNGAASTGSQCTHTYYGIARQANLVNVRVLDQNGSGSVSNVLAGIQWVVAHRNDNPKSPIRVLNLSLGHPVGESYTTDPLCQAVEAAWKAGIVVVCAAGNAGRVSNTTASGQSNEGYGAAYGSIQSPANDPYVITVGATKSVDGSRWHDRVATYSSRGPSRLDLVLKPDIIAPGNRVISLDVDWATLNAAHQGTNMVPYSAYSKASAAGSTGALGANNQAGAGMSNAYFCLSGTSMASPVVAGAAALMLQANPNLSPDTVKARLMVSADKWTDGSAANQHWIFQDVAASAGSSSTSIASGHTYHFVNVNSGLALDDTNFSTINGTRMEQWDNWGGAPEQWTVTDLGNGYWKIVNVSSHKALEVGGGASTAGGNVQQWDWTGSNWQQWSLMPVGDGSFKIVNRNSGLVVDVDGASTTHGTLVHQWSDQQKPTDPCTYGAGYLDIPAAIASTVTATQAALSPTLTQDASGNVSINASGIVSASHVIWGTSVNDLHVIWGTNAVSGSGTLAASHVIWGSSVFADHVIWGTSTGAVDLSSVAISGE